jgi:hypothetical protein
MCAIVSVAFTLTLHPGKQAAQIQEPQEPQPEDDKRDPSRGLAWVLSNASRIEQLLIAKGSPLPEIEPVTG